MTLAAAGSQPSPKKTNKWLAQGIVSKHKVKTGRQY